MHKQLTQLAALSLTLVPALTASHAAAGIVVDNPPDYKTAKVDPVGVAEDTDGAVGPNFSLFSWNAQTKIYTVNFDQTEDFTNGWQLDKVNLTALGQSITFSSNNYTAGQGFKVDNTALRCTSGTQSITTMASLIDGSDSNPDKTECDILSISFATPVTGVAFTAMFEMGGLQVAYYNSLGSRVYWANRNGGYGDDLTTTAGREYFFNCNEGGDISHITIKRLYEATSFSIDDLSFTQVPEPAGLILLGLGALALGRRRQG